MSFVSYFFSFATFVGTLCYFYNDFNSQNLLICYGLAMYSEHVPLGAHYPRFHGIFDVPASGTRFRPHRAATFASWRYAMTAYCFVELDGWRVSQGNKQDGMASCETMKLRGPPIPSCGPYKLVLTQHCQCPNYQNNVLWVDEVQIDDVEQSS